MATTKQSLTLTDEGVSILMDAAIAYATQMGVPQCIAIVDEGCNLRAFHRMDGAKILSIKSSTRKAISAASSRVPTGGLDPSVETKLALATDGDFVNLKGGAPIVIDGHIVGGIGVGSGTGEQDAEVANAALAKLGNAKVF